MRTERVYEGVKLFARAEERPTKASRERAQPRMRRLPPRKLTELKRMHLLPSKRRYLSTYFRRFMGFLVLIQLFNFLKPCTLGKAVESQEGQEWPRQRTVRFTEKWTGHKSRNVASYFCLITRKVPILNAIAYYLLVCPDVFYDSWHDELFEVPRHCIYHGCLKRFGRSHYLYAEFVMRTYSTITSRNIQPPAASKLGKVAVIIEPRRHPLLEYTVKQVMLTLGTEWSLQLFLSSENEEWIRQRFQIFEQGVGENIVVTPLSEFGLDDMTQYGNRVQSALSVHEKLYDKICGEHILWFQVDVLLRASPSSEWLKYAYIGSEWYGCEYPKCSAARCNKVCGGGNSGLSLRRRSKILTVATRGTLPDDLWGYATNSSSKNPMHFGDPRNVFASDTLRDNSVTRWFEDDLQLSSKLQKLGVLPPDHVPRQFAISEALPKGESVWIVNPTGMHKTWATPWIHPRVIMGLLREPFERVMITF